MNPTSRHPAHLIAALAIALPWLNPFAPGPSPPVLQWLVTLVCTAVLLGLIALRQLAGKDLARVVAHGWLLAALLSSGIGLLQYFGVSGALTPWVNATGVGEAFANLRQRNQFATLTNVGLAALLWWQAQRTPQGDLRQCNGHSLPLFLMAALLALGNATSSSRTGMVQLFLLGTMAGVWHFNGRKPKDPKAPNLALWLMLVGLLVYGLALLALPRVAGINPASHGLLARLAEGDSACSSRTTLWRNVLTLIVQHPWQGWGWRELSYAHYITPYPGLRFCEILDNAHNLPLHLAVELGLPCAVLLCCGAFWLTLRVRPWSETDPAKRVAWAVLAVILLHSMLEYPLWYGPFLSAALLCLALLLQDTLPAPVQSGKQPGRGRNAAGAMSAALLLFSVALAWDYHRVSQIFLSPTQRDAEYQYDTLNKVHSSWFFGDHVRYAALTTATVTRGNAAELHAEALALLHFSPEARVIEKVIESAVQLGLDDEALLHMQRYRAAFPAEYAQWLKAGKEEPEPAPEQ